MGEYQVGRFFRIATQEPPDCLPRHEVIDVSRVIPTRLPQALRDASDKAWGHAEDPLNPLDYNPYISEEWAIVAVELKSLAATLERRFAALFSGTDPRYGLTRQQSTIARGNPSAPPAMSRLIDNGSQRRLICS